MVTVDSLRSCCTIEVGIEVCCGKGEVGSMAQDFTIDELSKITGRHPETLRRLAREGQIPGMYRLGRHWLM